MAYTQTFNKLWLACLTPAQKAQTCGYWYTVTTYGCTPHTAFRTRAALLQWLDLLGLSIERPLPGKLGEHDSQPIIGSYRRASYMEPDALDALQGVRFRCMDNGDYTLGVITQDEDGLRTMHHLNPNVRSRLRFEHGQSHRLEDEGRIDHALAADALPPKRLGTFRVEAPFVDDMGTIAPFTATGTDYETPESNALWHINRMRMRDNLPPLDELPPGTTLTQQ